MTATNQAGLGGALIAVLLLAPVAWPPAPGLGSTTPAGSGRITIPIVWGPNSTHIQHIVTVVMENHDYDSYFGTYCQTLGPYCNQIGNGIPNGTCIPYTQFKTTLGCIAPFNLTDHEFQVADMPHNWISGQQAYDDGAMDGFYLAEEKGSIPFGHYNGSTIPIYWDLAEQYAIGDNMFAANLTYSLPNHWDLLAGQSPAITATQYIKNTTQRSTYLREANSTPTVEDLLNATNVSWKYYDFSLSNYTNETSGTGFGSAFDYWNPMASRAETYSSAMAAHFVNRTEFLTDALNGTLPQLSWVIPASNFSDHPGFNLTYGESWVAQLIDAVEASPDWSTTAVFVVWDDYGGWYDHVAPPTLYGDLLSFRSPILAIGPYAKEDYISHQFMDFFSLLRYVEWQFGLKCLTNLDCNAPPIFDFFDFNQTARPPMGFPTWWTQASYPMPLENSSNIRSICRSCTTDVPTEWSLNNPGTTNFTLGD